jgi:ribosomal protein L37E
VNLFRRKPKPEVGHIPGPAITIREGCILCGCQEFEQQGQRKGRCMQCGFPRRPVLISAKVKYPKGVTKQETRMVSEDALAGLRRVG